MRQSLTLLALIAAAYFVPGTGPAEANLSFCNKTSYVLKSAVAYEEDNTLRSKGWFTLRPGACTQILAEPLRGGRYYAYAESHTGHRGGIRTWGGSHAFCTAPEQFLLTRRDCEGDEERDRYFSAIDIGGATEWTTDFTELDGYTTNTARIAGAQRLLRDVGLSPGAIDGRMGNATRRAVNKFRNEHGISGRGVIPDELLDKLADVAATQQEENGYQFCNETGLELWTAIAYPVEGVLTSKGWFRIDANSCLKVVKDKLAQRKVFTYAEADLDNGRRVIWGGDKKFCTSDVKFEIPGDQDCEQRGYETTGFQPVDTQERDGWTQTFVYEEPQP